MRRRRFFTIFVPLAVCALLIALLRLMGTYDQPTWSEIAVQGCSDKSFALPDSVLPTELAALLGKDAARRNEELRNSLLVSFHELGAHAFPGARINVNCELAAYDPSMVNIYVVASDPRNHFSWANGLVLTRSDAGRVLVLGPHFWDFFHEAWKPVLVWPQETPSPDFASAAGEFYVPVYEIYLQWSIAHELSHMKLGHSPLGYWWDRSQQRQQEIAADVEAARMLRSDYYQITPHLLGLIQETMKSQFEVTYHHPWAKRDGEPFEYSWFRPEQGFRTSEWHIRVEVCDPTHPPFLLRSLSMLQAASAVAIEQRKQIEIEEKQHTEELLRQEGSLESELALEQMEQGSATPESKRSDRWAEAVNGLAIKLRSRVDVMEPFLGVCIRNDTSTPKTPTSGHSL